MYYRIQLREYKMNQNYREDIGKGRVIDVVTSMNQGYFYDMPVTRHVLCDYTMFTKTPLILNISNTKIREL